MRWMLGATAVLVGAALPALSCADTLASTSQAASVPQKPRSDDPGPDRSLVLDGIEFSELEYSYPGADQGEAVPGAMSEEAQRASKLFDNRNWKRAAPALLKVVNGETGDDTGNRQLASMSLAITLYHLRLYQASHQLLVKIAANGNGKNSRKARLWLERIEQEYPGFTSEREIARSAPARPQCDGKANCSRGHQSHSPGPTVDTASASAAPIAPENHAKSGGRQPATRQPTVQVLADLGGSAFPVQLVLDQQRIYWNEAGQDQGTWWMGLAGGTASKMSPLSMHATDAQYLYEVSESGIYEAAITRIPKAGGQVVRVALVGALGGDQLKLDTPHIIDGGHAYSRAHIVRVVKAGHQVSVTEWVAIIRARLQAGSAKSIVEVVHRVEKRSDGPQGWISGLGKDATHLYWTDPIRHQLLRKAKTGTALAVLADGVDRVADEDLLVVDDASVYFAGTISGTDGIWKAPKAGGEPELVGPGYAGNIVVSGGRVYWTDPSYGSGKAGGGPQECRPNAGPYAIKSVSVAGGQPTVLTMGNWIPAFSVVGNDVYFVDRNWQCRGTVVVARLTL